MYSMCLQCLSTELLTAIFEYCELPELYNLQLTCKRFYIIITTATSLGNARPFLVTNQLRRTMKKRSLKLLTLNEKFFKYKNWEMGFFKEYCMLREKKRYMPKIVLIDDMLWISKGNNIYGYKRNNIGISLRQADFCKVPIKFDSDVSTFVLKEHTIITGQVDGSIYVKKLYDDYICIKNAHDLDVHSVDLSHNTFVSGSKSGSLKIWNLEACRSEYCHKNLGDRIWSVALSKSAEYFGVGTAHISSAAPLYIYDTHSCVVTHIFGENFTNGSGLLQLKWEASNILLSCGYDGNVHKWDLRANQCVQAWKDPFLACVYCFDTDDYCTLVTGLAINGRTVLWDMRMDSYVQMYFMGTCKKSSYESPIYSLAFDVDHLFAATDCSLNIFHFAVDFGISRNYNKSVLPFLI